LVVSGSEARKNIPTLIRAFARAFPARDVELRIAGSMSASDEWILQRAQIRYVRLRPNDDELRTLYSEALAVAVPSLAEGYGLMAVEAMACGAPVIASNAAALGEACDGAAMLVPPLDVEGWASSLERVARDAALRERLREQSLARTARIDRSEPARATRSLLRLTLSGPR
jgi:glycosyltransferase involved in cell wall biosynthesis